MINDPDLFRVGLMLQELGALICRKAMDTSDNYRFMERMEWLDVLQVVSNALDPRDMEDDK